MYTDNYHSKFQLIKYMYIKTYFTYMYTARAGTHMIMDGAVNYHYRLVLYLKYIHNVHLYVYIHV